MIHINASITKTDLIRELESEADKTKNLYLIVESLPTFLNTPIAFTVFNYQISKYPRPVFWWSQEKQILDFLQSCTTSVANPELDRDFRPAGNHIINYDPNSNSVVVHSLAVVKTQTTTTASSGVDNIVKQNSKHVFSSEEMFSEGQYEPIDLIKEDSQNTPLEIQNFDSWIKKIEATKEALSSLQKTQTEYQESPILNKKKKGRVFQVLSLSLILSLIFILGLILFPAKVYTIEVGNITLQDSKSIDVPLSSFSKSTVSLKASAETKPQGNLEVPTDRANGEVQLLNEGSRPVNLDNGMFRLVLDQKYYQVIADNTLPKSFSILPASQSDKVLKFKVQAVESGSDYNLAINTKLDIVNLQGDGKKVCFSCYATTVTEIKNTAVSGQKVVTEYDQSLVSQNAEAKLALQRQENIKNLQRGKVFINENWYKNTSSQYTFNKNINEPTDILKLDVVTNTDIYYISQDQLGNILKQENQNIDKFKEITIKNTENDPRSSDIIKLTVFYTYETQNTCFDKQKFVSTLSSKDFDEAKKDILIECPGITNIEKKDLGINMPGIPTRIDLNLTQS